MNCPRCSTKLDDGARFCGACGTKLAGPVPAGKSVAPEAMMKTMIGGLGAFMPPAQAPKPGAPAPAPAPANPGKAIPEPVPSTGSAAQHSANPLSHVTPGPMMVPNFAPAPVSPMPVEGVATDGDPMIGRTLNNRYLIESKLGEGGFGAVYQGKQLQIGREVALKLLHPEMARDPNLVARFRREGAVACNLRDAHTITTYDFDQTADGILYIAMELLKGRSLHDVFHQEAPLPWERVFHVIEQMCSSLGEAHAHGFVHRDIKPENIYLENRPGHDDFVKILDFGIAKIVGGDIGNKNPQLTATGQTLGTLEYMSPEQLMGKQLDGRSDIYAMGVLAYELLTGHLPFPDAQGPAALIAAQLKRTPEPPSVACPEARIPQGVDQVIFRMIEKDLTKRFQNVGEVRTAVVELLMSAAQAAARGSAPAYMPVPPQAPVLPAQAQPPQGKRPQVPVGEAPSTRQAMEAATSGGKTWIWLVVAAVVVLGLVAFLALK
ncbi:MAG: protein kinase [Deltaproteobacteria bacterium]|nr:protein kinase [Deltaproteobacteria bacterium]